MNQLEILYVELFLFPSLIGMMYHDAFLLACLLLSKRARLCQKIRFGMFWVLSACFSCAYSCPFPLMYFDRNKNMFPLIPFLPYVAATRHKGFHNHLCEEDGCTNTVQNDPPWPVWISVQGDAHESKALVLTESSPSIVKSAGFRTRN